MKEIYCVNIMSNEIHSDCTVLNDITCTFIYMERERDTERERESD